MFSACDLVSLLSEARYNPPPKRKHCRRIDSTMQRESYASHRDIAKSS